MIITFKTSAGSIYHIDHSAKSWVQEKPTLRMGPLYNIPAVRIGRKVEIQTCDPKGRCALKIIETSVVVSREVSFA
jgi:hypothetical protein